MDKPVAGLRATAHFAQSNALHVIYQSPPSQPNRQNLRAKYFKGFPAKCKHNCGFTLVLYPRSAHPDVVEIVANREHDVG
ncbi:hypothetical protein PT2222_110320 [Paraburkholderia tropica]